MCIQVNIKAYFEKQKKNKNYLKIGLKQLKKT